MQSSYSYPSYLSVYDVEPEAPGATFSLVVRACDPLGMYTRLGGHDAGFCDTRLAVCEGGMAMLWDFERNTRILWRHTAASDRENLVRINVPSQLVPRVVMNCITGNPNHREFCRRHVREW